MSIPITPLLMLEGTVRPAGASARAFRLGLAMGIPARRKPTFPTVDALIRVVGDTPGRLRLFVDGFPSPLAAARFAHRRAGRRPTLPLWPLRSVHGCVVVSDAVIWTPDASLAGILISLDPGGNTVETAADGTFVFAKLPLAPGATIGVDPSSLPRALHAPERQPLPDGDVTLVLGPGLRIERQTFPPSR